MQLLNTIVTTNIFLDIVLCIRLYTNNKSKHISTGDIYQESSFLINTSIKNIFI